MHRLTAEELKEAIADALIALLHNSSLDKIGISEITALADVSRASFYRYFASKEDVLYYKFNTLADGWYNSLTAEVRSNPQAMAESFFTQALVNRNLLITMHQAKLHHIVLQALYHIMRMDQPDLTASQRYSKAFLAYGMFGILSEWISAGCKEAPIQLADLTLRNLNIPQFSPLAKD